MWRFQIPSLHVSLPTIFKASTARFSHVMPNPKKLAIVSQYGANTYDFSFLPPEYSVQFVDLDKVQSKQEFIDAIQKIEKDRVIVNLIDNCEDEENAEAERYFTNADAEKLKGYQHDGTVEGTQNSQSAAEPKRTLYRVSGLTAIACYERLGLAFTGASARNFATKKTDLKTKAVSTPKHLVVLDRKLPQKCSSGAQFPLRFPVLVKPLKDYGGSTFIQEKMKCTNMQELTERVENFPVPEMIIEEFIIGEEYEILIFDAAADKPGIPSLQKAIFRLERKNAAKFKSLSRKVLKKRDGKVTRGKVPETVRALHSLAEVTAEVPFKADESKCLVTNPNQVVLPSPDAFQHEELKWRALNAVCEKVSSGKTSQQEFMLKYRPVPQHLFPRGFGKAVKRPFTKDITQKLSNEAERTKLQSNPMVRDAYLARAIKNTSRDTWRILKHDGYFRYDFRVVQEKVIPPLAPTRISALLEKCGNEAHKLPKSTLMRLLPQYVFKVYVVDANPYCSVFGIPATWGDSDKLLAYTPYLSHRIFLERLVRAGILRELRRREAKLMQMGSRRVLSQVQKEWGKAPDPIQT